MKKNIPTFGDSTLFPWVKLLIIMKLIVIMLLGSITCLHASAYGQEIQMVKNNVAIVEFFREIKKQTHYNIICDTEIINTGAHIDVVLKKVPLLQALNQILLPRGLTYSIKDKNIIVRKADKPQQNLSQAELNKAVKQQIVYRGRVMTSLDPPTALIGAGVNVKGTSNRIATKEDGYFEIAAAPGSVLVFSMVGYISKEITLTDSKKSLVVSLEEDINELDQVIVTGVTKQQVKNLASSVAVVNMGNVANKPVTQLSQALQGGATGINVSQSSGLPGGDAASIKIRGIASSLGSSPLVLVDGIPYDIDKLDPNTIENVTILKDAAAAAIYGARAGNGVIVVTTKRGKPGAIDFRYNMYAGIQQPSVGHPEFVDASTYMEMVNEAQLNIGGSAPYAQEVIDKTRAGDDPVGYPNSNWYNSIIKKWTPIQQHSLSVSGGNEIARFALTASYLDQKNMISVGGFNRGVVRGNTSVNLSKNIVTFLDFVASRENQEQSYVNGFYTSQLLSWLYTAPPNIPMKYPNKDERPGYTYYGNYGQSWNPLAHIEQGGTTNLIRDDILLNLRPQWKIVDGLSLKGQFSYRVSSGVDRSTRDQYLFFDYFTNQKVGRDFESVRTAGPANRSSYYYVGGTLDYEKTFGKHSINAIGLYSQEYDNVNSWDVKTLLSYLGKVYYSYDSRYLLEVGIRRDGSSLFAKNQRWGSFPSIAIGWNVANESFLKEAKEINMLKLRGSFGTLGNNNIKPYAYQTTINTSGNETVFGNPNITWEKMQILDFGADVSLFSNKLDLTFDWYNKLTKDLILYPLPTLTSARGETPTNIGELSNKGYEIKLGYNSNIGKELRVNANIGLSYNKTKIVKQATSFPIISSGTIKQVGGPFNEWWGYRAQGLITAGDVDNKIPMLAGQEAGDIKYVDINGDGVINENDRTTIGNPDPLYNYFVNVSLKYKNLDFEIQANGVGNNTQFYWGRYAYPLDLGGNGGTPLLAQTDYWTPDNLQARYPKLRPTAGNNGEFSDYWSVNAAFLRIRYVQLGYTFGERITKGWAKSLRVFLNTQNPFVFSKMKLIDPESRGDQSTYSIMKMHTIGLNVNF
ncbi:TonB-dependent receptor [Sphingobacterium detergens]|uniref:TonB-linked SusC/RagA family outer membrane protein n=1 Tax=Sphingobacterium detergens TaxID=1145106 RepID=A0A420BGJ0_SPHD1|nr:TonB-dependent receptor [Sphingobacterium detergens]RKE55841.1 TonB-linked SusC/RagA family outer membrane protein [Sphingobacterium detergens]